MSEWGQERFTLHGRSLWGQWYRMGSFIALCRSHGVQVDITQIYHTVLKEICHYMGKYLLSGSQYMETNHWVTRDTSPGRGSCQNTHGSLSDHKTRVHGLSLGHTASKSHYTPHTDSMNDTSTDKKCTV